jgi:hypothetical protein
VTLQRLEARDSTLGALAPKLAFLSANPEPQLTGFRYDFVRSRESRVI